MPGPGSYGGGGGRTGLRPLLQSASVAGAVAGDLTVAGIAVGDDLVVVQNVAAAGANLASEFDVTAADTINNAGGTATTGMVLLVMWYPKREGKYSEQYT